MAQDRTTIAMQSQILELRNRGLSIRKISESLRISRKTIRKFIERTQKAAENLACEQRIPDTTEELEQLAVAQGPEWLQSLDWRFILSEQAKGVPWTVLWKEACAQGCGVQYWGFRMAFKKLAKQMGYSTPAPQGAVRFVHQPAEKVMVDYCDGVLIMDSRTGKQRKTQLFVGVLPFSGMVYAEFSFDQKQPSFIGSMERMWRYFGGVTPYAICDNLKSAVSKAHLYDPDVNPTFLSYANHAGFAVLPARPYKPRDKASVERHVGIIQQDFFFHIRHHTFYSLPELNQSLLLFLADFNSRIMKDYGVSRRDRFSQEEHLLQSLPVTTFEIEEWKQAKVHSDSHIQANNHFYSVPYTHLHQIVSVKLTPHLVTIFDKSTGEILAVHNRFALGRGYRSTEPKHWPEGQQQQMSLSLQSVQKQALRLGPKVYLLVEELVKKAQPLQYLRRIQGLLRLYQSKEYSQQSLEYACEVALEKQEWRLQTIKQIALHYTKVHNPPQPHHQAPIRPPDSVYTTHL